MEAGGSSFIDLSLLSNSQAVHMSCQHDASHMSQIHLIHNDDDDDFEPLKQNGVRHDINLLLLLSRANKMVQASSSCCIVVLSQPRDGVVWRSLDVTRLQWAGSGKQNR